MTIEELIAEIPLLGPWKLLGPNGAIRTVAHDDCPIAAAARVRGVNVNRILGQRTENPVHLLARRIGLGESKGELLTDAADGVLMHPFLADYERMHQIRGQLLNACGLAGVDLAVGGAA